MFKPIGPRADFVRLEQDTLAFWREHDIFRLSVENRRGGARFTLYEGPPTANGRPGIHHIISRVFKDVLPRYKTMRGYYAPRIGGWDTHGLPVELEVERELGFATKTDIEAYGIAKFNAKCRESVFKYLKDWNAITERIAFWVDLEQAYITMENSYIESSWWTVRQLWDKGLVYQGYRVTPHCPRCGTSLSSHEVAQGYKDDTPDPSVYVKFRLVDEAFLSKLRERGLSDRPVFLLAWTTTPWTLPGNTALAIAPDAEYAVIETAEGYLILASARCNPIGLDASDAPMSVKGRELAGVRYVPLYNPHAYGVERRRFESGAGSPVIHPQPPMAELTYGVIAADFVSLEDGSGIVHIAPAFGEVDFEAGRAQGLDFVQPVDLQGKIIGSYPFAGKFVKSADKEITADLAGRGLLHKAEVIRHTYPFCWRCDAPLLYYAKQSWYIKTTAVKDRLISGNQEINWYPEHIKNGRFGDWLQNNIDWAFSRERYWGTPVPVWQCGRCAHQECLGSLTELQAKSGIRGLADPLDLHRPYVDEIIYDCPECGESMKRVPEVMDCWFDSGNMPIAQHHYPFAPESTGIFEDGRFPADYICEAVDQTRGWFYSLHALSILLFDRPCYRNVVCLGHILDAQGEKMSKSRKNVVEPWPVLEKHGADALRWYLFTASPPGNARRFSEQLVGEVTRQFMLILWNVYSFFITYANIDHFNPAASVPPAETPELDRWLISEANQLVKEVTARLDGYDITAAGRAIEEFAVEYLSNWYVRRSRRRFWKSESDTDKLSAYHTLYQTLVTLSKLLAPFMPYLSEEMYRNLVISAYPGAPASVHFCDFPAADEAKIDNSLSEAVRLAMKLSSLGRAARSAAGLKVRQPLPAVIIKLASPLEKESLARVRPQLLEELNIKDVQSADSVEELDSTAYTVSTEGNYSVAISKEIPPELLAEGLAREIVHRLQNMRKSAGFDIADRIATYYQGDRYALEVFANFADYIRRETLSECLEDASAPESAYREEFKLDGHLVSLGVSRLAADP
ncbi:MAG: isoleucine--tRNA ligase [Dehalococcoidia bacterium]|nr:isoleucine--tRNA ligase [Dehalococcoidia bacterium]